MQDEEYPAYLKKQTYDDLVAISYSFDKEAADKRYEMLLAEIAERDKRGEKMTPKRHGMAMLCLGVFFIFQFILDLIMSRAGWKYIIHLALGIVCLITAWFSQKRKR
jgi:hypothetical protein